MIKVSVMYPNTPGARFDIGYYATTHMPLVQRLLGPACAYYSVDRGIASAGPGSLPPYVAMCHIFSESLDVFQAAMGPHAGTITADLPNFTDLRPLFQISEVLVGDR